MLGPLRTLRAGNRKAGVQCRYVSGGAVADRISANLASFRFFVAVCDVASEPEDMITPPDHAQQWGSHGPGWLQA